MWRYYELLTDVRSEQIAAMKADAANGKAHPMALKKELARSIVADFHSPDAATKATEDWAKQFQKKEVPDDVEEVFITLADIGGHVVETVRGNEATLRADRLLVKCGLANSTTDAARKLKQGSVRINDHVQKEPYFSQAAPSPMKLPLRVGKRVRIAVISW
jgi:tyrosyl-tRNA synthetase